MYFIIIAIEIAHMILPHGMNSSYVWRGHKKRDKGKHEGLV